MSPVDEAKSVPNTEEDKPMFVIIISSVCGTITLLTIAIAIACVKYDRWNRSRVTESNHDHHNNVPLYETNSHEYDEIGEVDKNLQGNNTTDTIRQNFQSSRELYQSLNVCHENSYLRINERPTLRDDVLLEVTNLSHYEQMMRSQIGDNDDAYQALQDVKGEK